jgi:hypothetical protein
MLSAVLQVLQNIQQEPSLDRKQVVLDFCVSAYPDIQPWQVEKSCEGAPNLYYSYLSQLLHPMDGHDSARRDAALVQTWCELSVKEILDTNSANDSSTYRSNFLAVASRTSSYHLVYHRDLPFLLINSMEIKESGLALDLGTLRIPLRLLVMNSLSLHGIRAIFGKVAEILEDPNISNQSSTADLVVQQMQLLAIMSLNESQRGFVQMLRRIVRLYSKASFRKFVNVPSELLLMLRYHGRNSTTTLTSNPSVVELIQFLTEEAISGDVLQAMFISMKDAGPAFEPEMVAIIQKLLVRGAVLGHELSSSLHRIRQAKKRLEEELEVNAASTGLVNAPVLGIWTRMASGTLPMDK